MLKLENIKKDYLLGEQTVPALKGINLHFADRGLVAILGPSGCGKTTLMNIVGGLDRATSGDLIIDGISTKAYGETEWNNYRNHRIGFVFQAYNLIPHMSVFSNVELALTLSGVSAKERKKRVLAALTEVGLSDQVNKKPNQMSGGQMQRVAIARALVNNPKILIADEPTGAVDSQTGIQIMEILKEVSKTCLVILVTHNKELANVYADRTINMSDGLIQSDYQEVVGEEIKYKSKYKIKGQEKEKRVRRKIKHEKTKMRLSTSTKLSFRNLLNKKWRSLTTIISGAISVICIALILSMNSGFAHYINEYEKSNLSRYPIKVSTQNTDIADLLTEALTQGRNFDKSNVDFTSILNMFKEDEELREKYTDVELVYLSKLILAVIESGINKFKNIEDFKFKSGEELNAISTLFGISLGSDIIEFKQFIEKDFNPKWGAVMYNYDIDFDVYRQQPTGEQIKLNPVDLFIDFMEESGLIDGSKFGEDDLESNISSMLYGEDMRQIREMFDKSNPWSMMIDNKDLLELHYDILAGRLPAFGTDAAKNEIVLVVDEYNQLDDFTMFLLGVITVESFLITVINQLREILPPSFQFALDLMILSIFGNDVEEVKIEYEFEEFIGSDEREPTSFILRVPTDYYALDEETEIYNKMGDGIEVEVVGILRLKPGVNASVISGAIGYTEALARELITRGNKATVLTALDGALNEYNQAKRSLVNTIKRVVSIDINIEALANISVPDRANLLIEMLGLGANLEFSPQRINLLMEAVTLLEGFEFTPENRVMLEEIMGLLSSYNISPENYSTLLEVVSLLEDVDVGEENSGLIMEMLKLAQELTLDMDNVNALTRVVTLLSEVGISDENLESLERVILAFKEIDTESNNLSILNEIGQNLSGVALSPERIQILTEILEILTGIDWEAKSEVIENVIDLTRDLDLSAEELALIWESLQTLADFDPEASNIEFLLEALRLIRGGESSNLNIETLREIMNILRYIDLDTDVKAAREILYLLFDLGLSSSELTLIWNSMQLLTGLNLESSEITTLVEVVGILRTLEFSESNKDALLEAVGILNDIEINNDNIVILTDIIKVIMGIELSKADIELLVEVITLMSEINIIEDDVSVATEFIELIRELTFDSGDIFNVIGQMASLIWDLELTRDEFLTIWELVSLVEELDLTSEDMDRLGDIQVLAEKFSFSDREQNLLENLLGTMREFNLKDADSLANILDIIRQIELSDVEVTSLWQILESLMLFIGFDTEIVEEILGFATKLIELNLSDFDIDILAKLLPKFLEIDFSNVFDMDEAEILKQIGGIFQIRNIVVPEDSKCMHSPNAPHTIGCAWFDIVQFDSLINSFKLRDLERPSSIDIYSYSIESRNEVLRFLNTYNKGVSAQQELAASTIDYSVMYVDELSEITTSMSSMINTITYMLIAVAAVAVIVAMLLVAIILYISIQDRTKEIGLLRSLGASKSNISSLFIAETLIIGLVSGLVGVIIALILTFPANLIISSVLGISNLLRPIWWHQFALVGISLLITIISGLIPATLAAKKDPVLALRIE